MQKLEIYIQAIGEIFPEEKIRNKIPDLIDKIKYTQNKLIWMKAALGIMTTDTCLLYTSDAADE